MKQKMWPEHHSSQVELQEQFPNIFNKQNSSVNDPFGDVHRPNASDWAGL